MTIAYYRVTPLEPLIARDSRPINNNSGRARSLDWLTPSVIAGAVRSTLHRTGICTAPVDLKKVNAGGGFLIVKNSEGQDELCFPRPQDALIGKPDGVQQKCYPLRPLSLPPDCGLYRPPHKNNKNEPSALLQAKDWFRFCYTNKVGDTFKPDRVASYWPAEVMTTWLNDDALNNDASLTEFCAALQSKGQQGARRDEPVHVSIDPVSGTARDGILFGSDLLDFNRALKRTDNGQVQTDDEENVPKKFEAGQLSFKVDFGNLDIAALPDRFFAPVGGDRRLAEFVRSDDDSALWARPTAIPNSRNLRMILATPALFNNGWLPGWIDETTGKGKIPGTEICVSLVSANAGRWKPISGWSYADNAPKPLRRMAPEGSVYFFIAERVLTDEELNGIWLSSVCDDGQDRNDGFGLALWGTWN